MTQVFPTTCERMDDEIAAIQAFTRELEAEFLDLGALLRNIAGGTRSLREHSDRVLNASAGQEQDATIGCVLSLFSRAQDLVQLSCQSYGPLTPSFARLRSDLKTIAYERQALSCTVGALRAIRSQFRIQACHLEGEFKIEFGVLADAIGSIIDDLGVTVDARFSELEASAHSAEELHCELGRMGHEHSSAAHSVLDSSREQLARLQNNMAVSGRSAQAMADAGMSIFSGVSRSIVALQCQDGARQRFEHICAALKEMSVRLGSSVYEEHAEFVGELARLQLKQVDAVFQDLSNAALQITTGLEDVQACAGTLAEIAANFAANGFRWGTADEVIGYIRDVLKLCHTAAEDLDGMRTVLSSLELKLTDCTSQVLQSAGRLRLMAINAQIYAEKVERAEGLKAVASCTRDLANDAVRQLGAISLGVRGVLETIQDINRQIASNRERLGREHAEAQGLALNSESMLTAMERELQSALAGVQASENQLSQEIRTAVERIIFPDNLDAANSRLSEFLAELVTEYHDDSRSTGQAHAEIEAFRGSYTMGSERDIHQASVMTDLEDKPEDGVGTVYLSDTQNEITSTDVELF